MRSVNKVVLMGHMATDPEVKAVKNGSVLAKFKLATNRDWRDSSGERHEMTDFHRVIAWSKLGEIVGKNLKKGAPIYLEGRISNREYLDKDGNNKAITEIVADLVNFISFKKDSDGEQVNLIEVPA